MQMGMHMYVTDIEYNIFRNFVSLQQHAVHKNYEERKPWLLKSSIREGLSEEYLHVKVAECIPCFPRYQSIITVS